LQDETNITETQLQKQAVDINTLIQLDSNVINYGQFICGKILGSTLQVINQSDEEQSISMKISDKISFNCDDTLG